MVYRNTRVALWIACSLSLAPAPAARLKEIAAVEGVRSNQLIGYGLVVGLNGTGDRQQTVFSVQSLTNLLQQMGVSVPAKAIRVNNLAAVMVTASLPPFAQPGGTIDATVAAIGDATNLQGGLLLLTTLKSVDGQPFAVAQGPVVTGGFVAGRSQTSQMVNHPTVGRLPNGAIVERAAPSVAPTKQVRLQLRQSDFTTAARAVAAINKKFAQPLATAPNAGLVQVDIPPSYSGSATQFMADLESIDIETDRQARVVVNERTGTIALGKLVKVSPIAIMHGNLSIQVETNFTVSQPGMMSKGKTEIIPQTIVDVKEEKARNIILREGATVEQLVGALIGIGSTPRDIIAILQNLKSAGALDAELEVI
jgi:flagellar P-ring protein precursor FlgI